MKFPIHDRKQVDDILDDHGEEGDIDKGQHGGRKHAKADSHRHGDEKLRLKTLLEQQEKNGTAEIRIKSGASTICCACA